ncbi:hypothetical protein GQ42DRAFT_46446 [Ramicandelaber brevisporus]|nr:hypothetical protein GQ42DRAFT_46446 [Ramicandelaber brevisporus]
MVQLQNILKKLIKGPGAAPVNTNISKLVLTYDSAGRCPKHQRFVRDVLPRVQFFNPKLPIVIAKKANCSEPTLTIYRKASGDSATAAATATAAAAAVKPDVISTKGMPTVEMARHLL